MCVCDKFCSLSINIYVLVCYLEILVQFLTFKSEPFEQNAINKMEIELLSSDTTKPASHHDAIAQGRYMVVSCGQTIFYGGRKGSRLVYSHFLS